MTHRFGDVAVMFSVYTTVVESGGRRETQRGRATEVFVRSKGCWVHTSWQLDKSPWRPDVTWAGIFVFDAG